MRMRMRGKSVHTCGIGSVICDCPLYVVMFQILLQSKAENHAKSRPSAHFSSGRGWEEWEVGSQHRCNQLYRCVCPLYVVKLQILLQSNGGARSKSWDAIPSASHHVYGRQEGCELHHPHACTCPSHIACLQWSGSSRLANASTSRYGKWIICDVYDISHVRVVGTIKKPMKMPIKATFPLCFRGRTD